MTALTNASSDKLLYKEAMEQVHSYNSKLLLDRRLRMPYIDSQTGLAHQDCHLWVSRVQRCAPMKEGQIYSYPSRRWRVKRRPDFTGLSRQGPDKSKQAAETSGPTSTQQEFENAVSGSTEDGNTPTNPTAASTTPVATHVTYYEQDYDDAFASDFDSDDDIRPKKRKKLPKGKKNVLALKLADSIPMLTKEDISKMTGEDALRPYACQICTSKRYKNAQGLRYHYEHHNHELEEVVPSLEQSSPQTPSDMPPVDHVSGAKRRKGMPPTSYCDFCLGNSEKNKKSGASEKLISCADCGRSAHPSCLQFNEELVEQVDRYEWQCIECKSCCLCGTSDNDEQLLFCDDCDRGYHMYCLRPPISEPPEGSWQCQLCAARVKGEDVSKVAVLSQHMDKAIAVKAEQCATPASVEDTPTDAPMFANTATPTKTATESAIADNVLSKNEDE